MNDDELLESVIGFDALYESMYKCMAGVGWKDSVASYCLNGIENTLKLESQLKDGSYTARPKREIKITCPKPRDAISIAYRDRVYQRSLNDNVIYPAMSKQFISSNTACQKGKGTDYARDLLDKYLHEVYRKHGTDAYVLQIDIKGYYANMRHAVAEASFERYLPPEIFERVKAILRDQYEGDVGYNPGSQMIQIAGISVLSPLDHFIKERLRIKWYLRYMDDLILIHPNREYLEECRARIDEFLSGYGFSFHSEKTSIYPLKNGIKTLGFTHRLTNTGKVIRLINPENVRRERKKLYRMVQKAKRGEITKRKADSCYESWKSYAGKGNCHNLIKRMDAYYKSLWKEPDNGDLQENKDRCQRSQMAG